MAPGLESVSLLSSQSHLVVDRMRSLTAPRRRVPNERRRRERSALEVIRKEKVGCDCSTLTLGTRKGLSNRSQVNVVSRVHADRLGEYRYQLVEIPGR